MSIHLKKLISSGLIVTIPTLFPGEQEVRVEGALRADPQEGGPVHQVAEGGGGGDLRGGRGRGRARVRRQGQDLRAPGTTSY